MSLRTLVAQRAPILAEGSIYELLRRDPRIHFDPRIAHAGLIYDEEARKLLGGIHLTYAEIATLHGLPLLALTDTWRASASRIAASPFAGRAVNRDNVVFLQELLHGRDAFVAGLTGPAGDAYKPAEAPSHEQALSMHAAQIENLAAAGVDLLYASTLPSTIEARAIGELMSKTGVPWMLSFVVQPDGRVLDGVPLADAIRSIDDSIAAPALGYAINCVHSAAATQALATLAPSVATRMIAFQGNASRLSPEELDGRAEIDSEPPREYADGFRDLIATCGIPIVGGCCGTSPAHLEELAGRIARRS